MMFATMRTKRMVCGFVVSVAALIVASPASAHEEITPHTFPTGRPVFLTLSAANEESDPLTRVTLRPPPGVTFGIATQQPPGWTPERSGGAITWSGGTVPPDGIGQWSFEIDAVGQPGPLRFTVQVGFADGSSTDSQVEVVADGPPVDVAATTTTPRNVTTTEAPSSAAAAGETDSNDGLATAALVVAIISAVISLLAIALAARRRPAAAPGAPATTAGPGQGEEQDW